MTSPTVAWTERELQLQERLERGETVVLNARKGKDDAIKAWARKKGLLVYIGRTARGGWRENDWRNPPTAYPSKDTPEERTAACQRFAEYLAGRPDLLARIHELKGKALVCWCAPLPCHGDHLASLANQKKG
jgi:hypothetical protein